MTAKERTQAIWDQFENMPVCNGNTKAWMLNAIERACIEHSNAELGRRRAVEAKLAQAREALTTILTATSPCGTEYGDGYIAGLAEAALKALEGGGDEQAKRKQIREDNMIGEAGI